MTASEWDQVPFENILADSKDGEWGKGESLVSHTACWMIRGTDFAGLNDSATELPLRWIPDHLMNRKRLQPGDIVFEMAGGTATQTTGRSALVRRNFFDSRTDHPVLCASFCRHLRLQSEYDSTFIYYLLQALYRAGYMGVFNIQHTGVSRFQYTSFKKKTILTVPRKPVQKKIAAILSAYDELIENNRRRIGLLEKLAEELYREWFVRLRFPGHEKVKFVKGVPEGWEVQPFADVVEINPPEKIDKEEERPFVAMDELSVSSMYFSHSERRKGHVGPKFRNGDVLFPRITPSVENGKRGFVMTLADGEVAQGSTEFIVLREKILTSEHIYFLSVSDGFRTNAELSMTGASGRQRVQEKCFAQFLVKVPPLALRDEFTSVIRPMISTICVLSTQNEALRKTRDLLLPRLISGKLSVEDLDIQFPPGMQSDSQP